MLTMGRATLSSAATVLLTAIALSGGSMACAPPGESGDVDGRTVEVRVMAASSLSAVFTTMIEDFEAENPKVKVVPTFAGSATLATQIRQGSPFEVVALADSETMDKLVASGEVATGSVKLFAENRLAIVVPKGNPWGIRNLGDLTQDGPVVAMCNADQPCGRYTIELMVKNGVTISPLTLETSASAVVSRVATGEADAGVAYATDGLGKNVDIIVIPENRNVPVDYPIGIVRGGHSSVMAAEMFVDYVLSETGREILTAAGFIVR